MYFGRLGQALQVRLDQTGSAIANQQRLEGAVTAYRGEVVGVQQRVPGGWISPSSVTITPVGLDMATA